MKRIKSIISIIFSSLLLCFIQCTYAGKPINKTNDDTAIQNAILFYINEYRQQHGLTVLKMDNRIASRISLY
ncbi:MAG: CAP domain-containing protein, partial [Gammaproteobacteria bacterium]|nr:CAP domain-containing protein [Gammaproteobacteria bacterium]